MTKGGRSAGRGTDQTKSPILSGEMDKTRPAYNADGINGEEGRSFSAPGADVQTLPNQGKRNGGIVCRVICKKEGTGMRIYLKKNVNGALEEVVLFAS